MPRLGLYQPFIEDRNVRRLYRLKVRFRTKHNRRLPMTALLNRILDDFFDSQGEVDSDEPACADPRAPVSTPAAATDLRR